MNADSISNLGDALDGVAPLLPLPVAAMTADEWRAFCEADTRRRVNEARADRWRRLCPPAYLGTDFADPRLAHNVAQIGKVLRWQYGPRGLLLAGVTGLGKTRSLWGLLRRWSCDEGHEFVYWNAQDLSAEISLNARFGRDEARAFIGSLARVPLLVLDELGQEKTPVADEERVKAWLFRLFDLRLELGLPLIAATNCTSEELARIEGGKSPVRADPLIRRLLEIAEPVKFFPAAKPVAKAV